MNELQIFNSEEFGDIRTVTINNEPWFVGKDVAVSLGYKDTSDALKKHVEDEDKLTRCFADSGQNRQMYIINESGLYALIFGSRLESAKRFKHWVTSEVLPAIRKTGSYQKPMTTDQKIQLLAQGNVELTEKIEKVNEDLQEFKKDMPLLALECQKITRAKNQKVVPLMGGKSAPAYKNKSLMHKVYGDIDAQLRREFGVNTYKAIKRNQCDLAISIIEAYKLPMFLQKEIDAENAQMHLPV
ncbi:ORF6C domain-containing protein [[Ruminococcus] lactaris]|jgi:prophage antirepressor-like protein|uniref:ORF6C domain-containing protein n=1 Tax=[Ruminococcus] lactaris TaxID=46228 RepID=UPI0026DA835D|nr:ORF6C domain-containing protein [[Ruminococcus] lactaris]